MKRNQRLSLMALSIAGILGSCTYYETPTTATPEYGTERIVTTLPDGYRTVTISGTRYYTYGDSYYRPHGSGYVIVDSPYDTRVMRELPPGYQVITRHGQRYYQSGNVYYQQRSGGYVVVDSPF